MLNPFSNRRLLKRGESARARIVEMTEPEQGPTPSKVTMTLHVERFDGAEYEITDQWMVAGTEPIGPGSPLWVVVDPTSRHRVAIDWDRTRAEYRQRSDKRRQMLSVGVPVPVSKVREAAADIGYEPWSRPVRGGEEKKPASEPVAEEPAAGEEAGVAEQPMPVAAPATAKPEPPAPKPEVAAPPAPVVAPPPPATNGNRPKLAAVTPPASRPAAASDDLIDKLERLATLHDAGSLTDGEFEAAKRHVLGDV